MSYDVMIWTGSPPATDAEADALFEQHWDRHEELYDGEVPPTPQVMAFMTDIVRLWPDDDFDARGFPWAVAPVSPDSGAGDTACLTMTVHDRLDEMVADIARLARQHGLVAYDPQMESVVR